MPRSYCAGAYTIIRVNGVTVATEFESRSFHVKFTENSVVCYTPLGVCFGKNPTLRLEIIQIVHVLCTAVTVEVARPVRRPKTQAECAWV